MKKINSLVCSAGGGGPAFGWWCAWHGLPIRDNVVDGGFIPEILFIDIVDVVDFILEASSFDVVVLVSIVDTVVVGISSILLFGVVGLVVDVWSLIFNQ